MERDDLNMTPGEQEEIENATAYANRTAQRGLAGARPRRESDEALEGAATESGELDAPARSTVREGEDVGDGQRARRDGGDKQNPLV